MRLDWNVFFALALVCVVWTKACSIVSSSSHEIGNYRASVRSDSLAERDGFELAVPLVPHEKGRFLRLFFLRPGIRERLAKLGCIGEGLSVEPETSDVCCVRRRKERAGIESTARSSRVPQAHLRCGVTSDEVFGNHNGETGPSP
jgi:hypothetical protein